MNFHLFLWLLAASGRHARILLPLGVVLALLLPSSGAFFKPAAPYILAVLIGAALVRLDIGAVLKAALQPQRLIRNFAISFGLLIIVPVVFFNVAKWFGLPDHFLPLVTWYAVAPPIGTTIWMCIFLGFTAPIAMEIVVLTNLLAPFTGPYLGEYLLGAAVPISSAMLCLRLGIILGGGLLLALLAKKILGEDRIEANRHRLDGVSTLSMLAFLLPVFDGIGAMVMAVPILALACLGLVFGLNFGSQALVFAGGRLLGRFGRLPLHRAKPCRFPKARVRLRLSLATVILGCILPRYPPIRYLRFLLQPINYRFTLHRWWLAGLLIGHKRHDF